jgi:hypothetical protein
MARPPFPKNIREKIRLFNAANVELGYRILNILSPREVTTHEGP